MGKETTKARSHGWSHGEPMDVFFYDRHVEVDEQSKAVAGQFEVGERLGFADRQEVFNRLNFDDERVVDQQVEPKTSIQTDTVVTDWQDNLLADG